MAKTLDERIIFQNQSHLVQKYFEACGICPQLYLIAKATDLMVEYCLQGHSKELKDKFDKLEEYVEMLKKEGDR